MMKRGHGRIETRKSCSGSGCGRQQRGVSSQAEPLEHHILCAKIACESAASMTVGGRRNVEGTGRRHMPANCKHTHKLKIFIPSRTHSVFRTPNKQDDYALCVTD